LQFGSAKTQQKNSQHRVFRATLLLRMQPLLLLLLASTSSTVLGETAVEAPTPAPGAAAATGQ